MKAIWLIHLIITTFSVNLYVIGVSGHPDDLSASSSSKITKITSNKSSPSSFSSWFDNTGLYPNPLKPKLFQLPYEKITNPLSSFISWITQNERNVRTYDQLYLSGKSTGQRSPIVMGSPSTVEKSTAMETKKTSNSEKEITKTSSSTSLSSSSSSSFATPMTSSSNINPTVVKPLTNPSSSGSLSSLSSLSSAMFPSFKTWPNNHRRQDLLSSFSFSRSSPLVPSSSSPSSSRSKMFGSKDLSPSPQFSITFPRSVPPNKRQLSSDTLGIISKYNPNPKVFFIPKYYTSPYSVSVPFITHADKMLMSSKNHGQGRIGGRSRGYNGGEEEMEEEEDNYGEEDRSYGRDEYQNESIENNSMLPNEDYHSYRNSYTQEGKSERYRRNHSRRRNRQKNRKSSNKHSFSNQNRSIKLDHSVNQIVPNGENGFKTPMLVPRSQSNGNQQSKRYRSRSKSSSSSPWRAMNSSDGIHRPAPYTGKAQYSTIDNSSDPMSPSASGWIPFWTNRKQ